ncbi:MAG: hypothetical protein ACI353_05085, partial [Alloprevotella sp.]
MKRFTLFLSLCLVCLGTALGQTVVSTLEGLSNDKVYNILSARGTGKALLYHATSAPNNLASNYGSGHTDIAYSTTEPAYQFAIYKSDGGHYYIYSIAGNKFVGSVTGDNSAIPMTDALTNDIEIRTTGTATAKVNASDESATTYPFLLSTNRRGAVNLAATAGCHGVVNWEGGYTGQNADNGNCFLFLEVGNIDADVKSTIASKVTTFETPITITYNYQVGGTTVKSESLSAHIGAAFPAPNVPAYVLASAPEGTVAEGDAGNSYDIACTVSGTFPFVDGAEIGLTTRANAIWLVGTSEGGQQLIGTPLTLENVAADGNAYTWTVGGNWYDGFTFQNKLNSKYLAVGSATQGSGTAASMIDAVTELAKFEIEQNSGNYYFKIKGTANNYLSNHGGMNTLPIPLKTWNSTANIGDAGSIFAVRAVKESELVEEWKAEATSVCGYVGTYSADKQSAIEALSSAAEVIAFKSSNSTIPFESGKYYLLKNVARGYATLQSNGEVTGSAVYSKQNVNQLWQLSTNASGQYIIVSPNKEAYLKSVYDGEQFTTDEYAYAMTDLGSGQFTLKNGSSYLVQYGMGRVGAWASASKNGDGAWYFVPATEIEVAMNEVDGAYYATAYLPFGVTVSGATAYAVEATVSSQATATAVAAVPAKYGVVLKGESATATLTINDAATTSQANDLSGVLVATAKTEGDLVLGNNGGIGFYTFNGTDLAANKAYLPALAVPSEGGAAGMQLVFGGV